jgi:phage/plasmid primase-like uncharacterized protein
MRDDPRLAEARAMSIEDVAGLLGIDGLRRAGREFTGPCPACGGTDRFSINTAKGVFNCRHCGAKGQGVVDLVMWRQGVEFLPALDWLCGPKPEITAAEAAARRARAEKSRAAADERAAAERARAAALALKHLAFISQTKRNVFPVPAACRARAVADCQGVSLARGDGVGGTDQVRVLGSGCGV